MVVQQAHVVCPSAKQSQAIVVSQAPKIHVIDGKDEDPHKTKDTERMPGDIM